MKTIYTEIANEVFDAAYESLQSLQNEDYIDRNEDIEVVVDDEYYTIPCRVRGENTSTMVDGGSYDHPAEYDDRLWLSIEVLGDVSFEDEDGIPQYLPKRALAAVMTEEGYDYYEE